MSRGDQNKDAHSKKTQICSRSGLLLLEHGVTYRYSEPIPWAIPAPSLGPKRPMPRTKHASDQFPMPRTKRPHASDQIPMPRTNTPRTNAPCLGAMCLGAMARNSRGPLRKGTSLSHCASAHYSLLSLSSLSHPCPIVVVYYCLPITIYSPL